MLDRCVLPEAVGQLIPSLHEDLVDIHFPAYKGAKVAFEFRAFDCVPSKGKFVEGVLPVAQGAEDDCLGEVDEGSGHAGVSVDGFRNSIASANFGVDDREVVREPKGFDLVDLLQAVEQGVHDYREEDRGEGAALFQAVGHVDPDTVFLRKDGTGFHLGVQSMNNVQGPLRDSDVAEQAEKEFGGHRVEGFGKIDQENLELLLAAQRLVEPLVYPPNWGLDGASMEKGVLAWVNKTVEGESQDREETVGDDPVVCVGDGDGSGLLSR